MEELIKAKDEQIAKLNDLKELLKNQILSLQEENTKLKNEIFEIEEKISQLPKENTPKTECEDKLNSINAKLSVIIEKLDKLSIEELISSAEPSKSKPKSKSTTDNQENIKKLKPHPAEKGLIKPSALFPDINEPEPASKAQKSQASSSTPAPDPTASFQAADPRSLQRIVMEIEYPESGVIQCPKCGKMEFQEMPEPTRGSFAKKYYCKKCRQEWRFTF